MLLASVLAIAAAGVADSLPELRRCGAPVEPLGVVRSSGTVAFIVTREGRVDPATLEVLAVEQGTAAGLRSALARQLPRCRFRAARLDRRDVEARVRAQVRFEVDSLRVSAIATAASDTTRRAAGEPGAAMTSADTLDARDPRLEELPRRFDCRMVPRDEVITKVRVDGRIVDNPPAPLLPPANRSGLPPGEALLAYVVPAERKAAASIIEVRRASSNAHASAARERVASCRWAPGRVAGTPVAVRIVSLERFD